MSSLQPDDPECNGSTKREKVVHEDPDSLNLPYREKAPEDLARIVVFLDFPVPLRDSFQSILLIVATSRWTAPEPVFVLPGSVAGVEPTLELVLGDGSSIRSPWIPLVLLIRHFRNTFAHSFIFVAFNLLELSSMAKIST